MTDENSVGGFDTASDVTMDPAWAPEEQDYIFDPEKSHLVYHAKAELDAIGMTEDSPDEINCMMRKHLIHMVTEFAKEGHSGFSANYAIGMLNKLFDYKPLSPLSGKDEEWNEVGDDLWQNKRCSTIFKDKTGKAYNIDGIVFYEWNTDKETGEKYKSYFTCKLSRIPVEFPYNVPNEPIYEEWTEEWEVRR